MSLLAFPDEVLLDIFDYLYFYEIIYSFYELQKTNSRIHDLINSRLRSINLSKLDLRFMTKAQFTFICRYLTSNQSVLERIHDFTLSNQFTYGEIRLFSNQISFDQIINLKKLHLIKPAVDEYQILFPAESSKLTHLTLDNPRCDDNERVIPIDEMNELIELNILSNYPVQFRSEYSRVERLTVSQLNLIDLIGFSTFFPNLHYLDITLTGTEIEFDEIPLPLLTVLKLRSYDVEHWLCEKFLSNLLQLRELFYSNNIRCTKTLLVDGYRCQSFIERLPLLEQFEINLHLVNAYSTDICEITASFESPFYVSKNWNIVCESKPDSNDFHIYSVPSVSYSDLHTTTDSLVSSAVLPVDDPYSNINYIKLTMTSNWPLVTRFFPNIKSLELVQEDHSKMIPTHSILSYLNKSMFLSKIRKLILPYPCHFDDTLLRSLLQQSAPYIDNLDIPCDYLIRLIKIDLLQLPLSIRILTLRGDYLSLDDLDIFIDFFKVNLNCLSLYLQNNNSLPETVQIVLDRCQFLYSLLVLTNDPVSMLIHVQLCELIQQRSQASAELRPTSIRIWNK
ncbi:unnamed protein product [Rotaria magnacalcarata]|uniref:F-box domain-containing protein n=6 Tax=Rotaria magnacalcarata TaxID=392030 RepID=A0A818WNM8_9BILA|nr:unnamed protein product [Rotaria magnacalcarata]CAF2183319.1 unnamed protein product [Rotaria magnacalcarata]CAF3726422.1 unnamed protein product [Rotaria magnacalcarata]CAF4756028.1 unnamed protein product [Rotaria magnacalcarata]